ncbi:WCX domain-containing protein, partial [Streptomyces erythrochromogenes]
GGWGLLPPAAGWGAGGAGAALAGGGREAEVLGPPELRRALAETVTALADRYA